MCVYVKVKILDTMEVSKPKMDLDLCSFTSVPLSAPKQPYWFSQHVSQQTIVDKTIGMGLLAAR